MAGGGGVQTKTAASGTTRKPFKGRLNGFPWMIKTASVAVRRPVQQHRSFLLPSQIFRVTNEGVVYIIESKVAFKHENGGTTRQHRGNLERTN